MSKRGGATGAGGDSISESRGRAQTNDPPSDDHNDGILTEGSRFGVYVIGPCIGRGGMACVYRAEHEGLKRQVALKVLTRGFERDASGRERFLREARMAAAIRHPNVVSIFDVGLQEDTPYLVMELLEGEDLESFLATRGALDFEALIDMAVPVIAGLAAVHEAGVVHRDLKPANIFLTRGAHGETEPKLLDFGISKSSWAEHTRLTTAGGVGLGTAGFLSAEAMSGGEITGRFAQY
jgi:serine/threonine-protein kinase